MSENTYRFDTLKVRAAYNSEEHNHAVSVPIYQTASYDLGGTARAERLFRFEEPGWRYSRGSNPTVGVLEQRAAALDGASGGIALASGMAAITYTLLNLAENGGRILSTPWLYGGTADGFKKIFPRLGIHVDLAEDLSDLDALETLIQPDTKGLFIESVSNPNGVVADIEALARIAHRHGIPLVVDNTFATPYLLRPIEYGADIVIYSATKALSGHGNLIAGIVLESGKFPWDNGKFPQFMEKQYTLRNMDGEPRNSLEVFPNTPFTFRIRTDYLSYTGATLGPFEAYLALVGIETLSERVRKQVSNTKIIVEYLLGNEYVEWVKYPSLPDSPYYKLAQKYLPLGAGAIFSFGFKGDEKQIEAFIDSVRLFSYHVNVGDARSLIVNSPKTTHGELTPDEQRIAHIEPNLIRLSIGLEDPSDLIEDLDQAFAAVFGKKPDVRKTSAWE
ncbi:MAG: aminotransferase class I/II-fold pyridoxal phosphate-dependent enzyme [Synergistaceae bacterium]|jgi:O-acetylhomoserine (thiol)-lyase|nr:aminotransferase class I/II-fold pyridoxal phosphate-dependent enzyme [Synergistaceae bacterium]